MKFTTSIVAALGLVSSAMAAPAERSSDAETYEVSHVVARTGRSIVLTFQAAPVIFDLTIPLGTNEYDAKWVPTSKLHRQRVLGESASLTPHQTMTSTSTSSASGTGASRATTSLASRMLSWLAWAPAPSLSGPRRSSVPFSATRRDPGAGLIFLFYLNTFSGGRCIGLGGKHSGWVWYWCIQTSGGSIRAKVGSQRLKQLLEFASCNFFLVLSVNEEWKNSMYHTERQLLSDYFEAAPPLAIPQRETGELCRV